MIVNEGKVVVKVAVVEAVGITKKSKGSKQEKEFSPMFKKVLRSFRTQAFRLPAPTHDIRSTAAAAAAAVLGRNPELALALSPRSTFVEDTRQPTSIFTPTFFTPGC